MHNQPREPQPYEDCQAQDRLSDEMLDQGPDSVVIKKSHGTSRKE